MPRSGGRWRAKRFGRASTPFSAAMKIVRSQKESTSVRHPSTCRVDELLYRLYRDTLAARRGLLRADLTRKSADETRRRVVSRKLVPTCGPGETGSNHPRVSGGVVRR